MAALVAADGVTPLASRPRAMASAAMAPTAYQAADPISQELSTWHPWLGSADGDLLPERQDIVARIRDLARNNGWASGAVRRELDNVIGGSFRLSSKPDWRALGLTKEWAAEYAQQVEGAWRLYAKDPLFFCDATRHQTMGGLFALAYRHYVIDGDALAVLLWRPDRGGKYATTVRIVDPDRLSQPWGEPESDRLRGGVEQDEDGAAIAYHIRRSHPADIGIWGSDIWDWDRIERETEWGRPVVVHFFDRERDGQSRGIGRLTPILERLKMLDKYDKVELQAAVLNAILAAFVESPFDAEMFEGGLSTSSIPEYQKQRAAFHTERAVTMGGVRIPTLFPGEKIGFHRAERPATGFADFEAATLRNIAAGFGISYEQLSQDWSKTNYSSARAALVEVWKTLTSRRTAFSERFCTPIFLAWLEEAVDTGRIVLPAGAPDFYEGAAAYAGCKWIGPGRGWVDPVKEAQASVMRVEGNLSTLEAECAEQGADWQEVLEQRAYERRYAQDLGLPDAAGGVLRVNTADRPSDQQQEARP